MFLPGTGSQQGVPSTIWKRPPKTLLKRIVPPIWSIKIPKRSKEYNWNDLSDLERLFKKNIFVYALGPVQVDQDEEAEDKEDEHAAKLIYRSLCQYEGTVYLNLYENHFSYICDMAKYSHSYQCARCGKIWETAFQLN